MREHSGDVVLTDGRQPGGGSPLTGAPDAAVRMASLRGVDAAHLVLVDVDLTGCLFTGTVHLDQLRLGARLFHTVPRSQHLEAVCVALDEPRRRPRLRRAQSGSGGGR